jgi:hypothetical protein
MSKLTAAEYNKALRQIASIVFRLMRPHLPDARDFDIWANCSVTAAEMLIADVCKENDVEEPDSDTIDDQWVPPANAVGKIVLPHEPTARELCQHLVTAVRGDRSEYCLDCELELGNADLAI